MFLVSVIIRHTFAVRMKKISVILLFLFALVQAGPAFNALFSTSTVVFMVDEEKSEDKIEESKNDKKEIPFLAYLSVEFSHRISTALHQAEKIQAPPCLEKLTPPPNFC